MADSITHEVIPEFNIPEPLAFTEQAAQKVKALMDEEGNPYLMLRVYITGGGCSGFQYGFSFEETQNADDTVITKRLSTDLASPSIEEPKLTSESVKLLVDPMSLQYLLGAEIDYKTDIEGEQFIIRNPNAKTTCGCGSSFAA